jgi:hypothetical protein
MLSRKSKFLFYKKKIDKSKFSVVLYYYGICLVVFMLTTILISYTYFSVNYKYNKNVRLPYLHGQDLPEGFINISVELDKEKIVISTDDKKVFRWSVLNWHEKDILKFKNYLVKRIDQITFEAILAMKFSEQRKITVFSVDSKLAIIHILPIIHTLTTTNITHYAFADEKIIN